MPKRKPRAPTPTATELKLWKVVPVVPMVEHAKVQLMDDLAKMGCLGFADKP